MNYMKYLKLPVDPAPSEQAIMDALKKKRSTIIANANRGMLTPEARKTQLAELDQVELVMKNPAERAKAIKADLDEVLSMVRKTIANLKQAGISTYEKKELEEQAKKLNVQLSTVEQEYKKQGFTEGGAGPAAPSVKAELPPRYKQEKTIIDQIHALWQLIAETKTSVTDLYGFLEHYSSASTKSAPMSRRQLMHMDRKSLVTQVETWAVECSIERAKNAITTAYNNLLSSAKLMLQDEKTQAEYRNSMLYESCQALKDLEGMPASALTNPQYADQKIEEIAAHFSVDEAVALAIYNDKIKPGEYIPRSAPLPKIQCPNCNMLVLVQDKDGRTIKVCPSCKAELYMKCPKCGKTVPSVTERCGCGQRIRDLTYIPELVKQANLLIYQKKFGHASQVVNQIILLNDQAPELSGLKKAMDKFIDEQRKLYRELDTLCNARKYYAAKARSLQENELATGYHRASEIEKAVSEADELKKNAGPAPTEQQIIAILNTCADAPGIVLPAPKPARNVQAVYDIATQTVAVSWMASESAASFPVTYDVHRQIGGAQPTIIGAGLVEGDTSRCNCVDEDAPAGRNVWYYVVAKRGEKSAALCAAAAPVTVMHEVDEESLSIRTGDTQLSFVWSIPQGANGVRIMRGGRDLGVGMGMTSFSVTGTPGRTEEYVFQSAYEIDGVKRYTTGIRKYLAPTSLKPIAFRLEERAGRVAARWAPQPENTQIRFILTNHKFNAGDEVSEQAISAAAINGRVFNAQLEECSCELEGMPVGSYQVAGFVYVAGAFKACPPQTYSNIPAIRTKDVNYETGLGTSIILRGIVLPANATGVKAFLDLKKVTEPQSEGGVELEAPMLASNGGSVSLTGMKQGLQNVVTLFAVFRVGGKVVYSQPSTISINESERVTMECTLTWNYERVGGFLRKTNVLVGATLKIKMPPSCDYCPSLRVVCKKGLPPRSVVDGSRVMEIAEVDEDSYRSRFPGHVRTIQFTAKQLGDQIALQANPKDDIMLNVPTLGSGFQMKAFADASNFQIRADGDWLTP